MHPSLRHTGSLNTELIVAEAATFVVSPDPFKTYQSVCSTLLIFILILGKL